MSNYLKLEGIHGTSGNPKHIGEIDILTVDFSYNKAINHPGGISHSGKVFGDVAVKKKCDEDSNKLLTAAASGTTFPSGKLTLNYESGLLVIAMSNISIASYSSDNAVEIISLSFDRPT
jgi:type VI protein secretion system component Hcp